MYRVQTLIPRLQELRMYTPIFILGIKASIERSYVLALGVIHGNGCLKLSIPMVKERGGERGKKDWVERKREGGLGG